MPSRCCQPPSRRTLTRLRRFEQEAQAAAALNHPNILAIHRFGVFEGLPYLVSELLEGSTLRHVEERGPLVVRKAIDIGVQIAHGLAAAHEKGIVHRDLKPENLFVTKDGRVKILDFGLAKLTQPRGFPASDGPTQAAGTEPGMVLGTVGYMAPEQVRGLPTDHRTDIFAFGAVLYEMLSGKRAFQRSTSADTMAAILNEDPQGISQIAQTTPPGLQRVVHRCLEKNPEQRFQSASDLAFALEALSESGSSPSVAVAPPASKPRRWLPWSIALAVVVLIALFSFVAFTFWHRTPHATGALPRLEQKQITFLGNAFEPDISPDGRTVAYLTKPVGSDQKLMVQDLAGGPPLEILSGFELKGPSWSPDGSQLLVFRIESESDSVGGENVAVSRFGGAARPISHGAITCWLPGGNQILISAQNPDAGIRRRQISTGESSPVPAPKYSWLMHLSCNAKTGAVLLVTQEESTSRIWSMKPDGSEQRILVEEKNGESIESAKWSPGGDAIYYLHRQGQSMELVKLPLSPQHSEPIVLQSGLEEGTTFNLSSDGSLLIYTRQYSYSNLWSIDLSKSSSNSAAHGKALTSGTVSYQAPAISPDNQSVAFNVAGLNILKMRIDGGQQIPLTSFEGGTTGNPAWSPDGRELAFIRFQDGHAKVWIVSADGGDARPLERTDASDSNLGLSWSRDLGIVYPTQGLRNLRSLNADNQTETRLLPKDSDGWLLEGPLFSPDGKSMCVLWNRDPTMGIWLIDRSRTSYSELYSEVQPLGWSADGKSVYASQVRNGSELLQIPLASKKPKPVFSVPGIIHRGSVSPDGRRSVVAVGEEKSDLWLMKNFDPQASLVQ